MSAVQKYNFPDAVRGDTYNDVEFIITVNDAPQDLTGASIRMWVVDGNASTPTMNFNTEDDTILITDAANGTFRTAIGEITAAPKLYHYDIEITFANGEVKTWIAGYFNVKKDTTQADGGS